MRQCREQDTRVEQDTRLLEAKEPPGSTQQETPWVQTEACPPTNEVTPSMCEKVSRLFNVSIFFRVTSKGARILWRERSRPCLLSKLGSASSPEAQAWQSSPQKANVATDA